jgi:hypothetical protein
MTERETDKLTDKLIKEQNEKERYLNKELKTDRERKMKIRRDGTIE